MSKTAFILKILPFLFLSLSSTAYSANKTTDLLFKGQNYAYRGQYDEAIQCFLSVLVSHPQDIFARNQLALALVKKGLRSEAAGEFMKVLKHDPGDWFARAWLERIEPGKLSVDIYSKIVTFINIKRLPPLFLRMKY